MTASISYINLSWAVVGIIDKDVRNGLQSMKRPDEPIEVTIERYVIGYLVFWHIAFIDKEKMNRCNDEKKKIVYGGNAFGGHLCCRSE